MPVLAFPVLGFKPGMCVLQLIEFMCYFRKALGCSGHLRQRVAQLGAALLQLHRQAADMALGVPELGFQLVVHRCELRPQAVADDIAAQQADKEANGDTAGGGYTGGDQQVQVCIHKCARVSSRQFKTIRTGIGGLLQRGGVYLSSFGADCCRRISRLAAARLSCTGIAAQSASVASPLCSARSVASPLPVRTSTGRQP